MAKPCLWEIGITRVGQNTCVKMLAKSDSDLGGEDKIVCSEEGYTWNEQVRIIIPGHIGGRMVKWLEEIEVTNQESQNHYHFHDNRVLPSHVDEALAKAEGKRTGSSVEKALTFQVATWDSFERIFWILNLKMWSKDHKSYNNMKCRFSLALNLLVAS